MVFAFLRRMIPVAGLAFGFASPVSAGQVERVSVPSSDLKAPMPAMIYRPDGPVPENGFPVVYLLHGLGGSETDWLKLGDIEDTLDEMIAARDIHPVIVVMPGAGSSWYVDTRDIGGPGDVPDAIADDLRTFVEARYPTRRDRGGRAIAGLSMGGYGALRLGISRASLFVAVAALSPAIWQNIPPQDKAKSPDAIGVVGDAAYFHRFDAYTVTTGINLPPPGPHFGGMFGDPFNPDRFNAANIFTLLAQADKDRTNVLPSIFVSVGDDDSHGLVRGSIALYNTMTAEKRAIEFRVTDGDHVWSLWRKSIRDALTFIDTKWSPQPRMRTDVARN